MNWIEIELNWSRMLWCCSLFCSSLSVVSVVFLLLNLVWFTEVTKQLCVHAFILHQSRGNWRVALKIPALQYWPPGRQRSVGLHGLGKWPSLCSHEYLASNCPVFTPEMWASSCSSDTGRSTFGWWDITVTMFPKNKRGRSKAWGCLSRLFFKTQHFTSAPVCPSDPHPSCH